MCMANVRPIYRQTPDRGSSFVIQRQLKSSADIFLQFTKCVPLVNPQIQIKFLTSAYELTLGISGQNKLRFVIQKRVKSSAEKIPTTFHCR